MTQPNDQTEGLEPTETVAERIELTNVTLGFRPYLLLEAKPDPEDGELLIAAQAGGGAQEDMAALAALFLSALPFEQNPLSKVLTDVIAEVERTEKDAGVRGVSLATVRMIASEFGVPLAPEAPADPQ